MSNSTCKQERSDSGVCSSLCIRTLAGKGECTFVPSPTHSGVLPDTLSWISTSKLAIEAATVTCRAPFFYMCSALLNKICFGPFLCRLRQLLRFLYALKKLLRVWKRRKVCAFDFLQTTNAKAGVKTLVSGSLNLSRIDQIHRTIYEPFGASQPINLFSCLPDRSQLMRFLITWMRGRVWCQYLWSRFLNVVTIVQNFKELLFPLLKISFYVLVIVSFPVLDDGICPDPKHGCLNFPPYRTKMLILLIPQAKYPKVHTLHSESTSIGCW